MLQTLILLVATTSGSQYIYCGSSTSGSTSYSYDINNYYITLSSSFSSISINACGSSYDTKLYFYDTSGNELDTCDDTTNTGSGSCVSCGVSEILAYTPSGGFSYGEYTIGIGGYSDNFGNYEISVTCITTVADLTTPSPTGGSHSCLPLNTDSVNSGRCGPLFDYVRCNKNLEDYAIYCNSENGWCGSTNGHRDAQATDIYDWNPTSCDTNSDSVVVDVDTDTDTAPRRVRECGRTTVETKFHIGDVIDDVQEVIDDICSSVPGQVLIQALSVIPKTKVIGMGADALCSSVSFLGAICNLFHISECATNDEASIVASCWSSEEFAYRNRSIGRSTAEAFKYYLHEKYEITATYNSADSVSGEKYQTTEVTLDNCGSSDNYWIGGVYDSNDNGEQNNIVSEVVEYLVNHGIAAADNPVGGVSAVKQSASDGIQFTDIVRSKKGLLLHYDEYDYTIYSDETEYGIFLCEFNVVDGDFNKAPTAYHASHYLELVIFISVFVFAN